jgi:putative phosphoribosyl transferase
LHTDWAAHLRTCASGRVNQEEADMKIFEDRTDAGRQLGAELVRRGIDGSGRVVVLAIPRGGLPVAAEVVRALDGDFGVVVVRKLRSPHNPELGFGAVGPDGHVEIDADLVARLGISTEDVDAEIADRRAAVEQRLAMYREYVDPVDLDDAVVIVVDDGIATGGTASQALSLARRGGARRVILASPVAPARAEEQLGALADEVVILSTPAEFLSVGQAYRQFDQLDDQAAVTDPGR